MPMPPLLQNTFTETFFAENESSDTKVRVPSEGERRSQKSLGSSPGQGKYLAVVVSNGIGRPPIPQNSSILRFH